VTSVSRKNAAARAVDAGTVAAVAVNSYGIASPEAYSALKAAAEEGARAEAAGCTKADLDAEHARRQGN
jgi:ferritin-like metal-binding protein YciE